MRPIFSHVACALFGVSLAFHKLSAEHGDYEGGAILFGAFGVAAVFISWLVGKE